MRASNSTAMCARSLAYEFAGEQIALGVLLRLRKANRGFSLAYRG